MRTDVQYIVMLFNVKEPYIYVKEPYMLFNILHIVIVKT